MQPQTLKLLSDWAITKIESMPKICHWIIVLKCFGILHFQPVYLKTSCVVNKPTVLSCLLYGSHCDDTLPDWWKRSTLCPGSSDCLFFSFPGDKTLCLQWVLLFPESLKNTSRELVHGIAISCYHPIVCMCTRICTAYASSWTIVEVTLLSRW